MALNSEEGNLLSLAGIQIDLDSKSIAEPTEYQNTQAESKNKYANNSIDIKNKNTLFNKKQIPLLSYSSILFQCSFSSNITSRPPPFLV